jgi:3-dehydro-L-gulonate 2-dehydrogenase
MDYSSGNVNLVDQIIKDVQNERAMSQDKVRYPGERVLEIRKQNLAEGIPVEPQVWDEIQELKRCKVDKLDLADC